MSLSVTYTLILCLDHALLLLFDERKMRPKYFILLIINLLMFVKVGSIYYFSIWKTIWDETSLLTWVLKMLGTSWYQKD